jgi:hypothetical protein
MELPKDLSWEITTNENGVEMIAIPRFKMNEIVEYLKYAEVELKKLRVTDVSGSVCDFIGCKNKATNEVIVRNEYYCDKIYTHVSNQLLNKVKLPI